jgi:O-antigen/teichoic acid export membrane protein
MSLAQRSITSVAWNAAANVVSLVVLFVRSTLLARWLPVETFGIYAGANAVVGLSSIVVGFGMGGAFLHRTSETEDEGHAASVLFTLELILTLVWGTMLVLGAFTFASGQMRTALLLLTVTTGGIGLAGVPKLILIRRVVHRRLALVQSLNTLFTTLVALSLARDGVTLWALLSTDVVALTLTTVALYIWRPVWRPRLVWSPPVMRYLLRFGSRTFLAAILSQALDRIDDLWTGFYLGVTPLGFYARAYTFATYPRQVLAGPVDAVAGGTYAEVKTDRLLLSKAFFRTNALLVRSGFFIAGLLALIAPEFIRLVLSAKWLPMLDAFRLMLVFTLLDPIKATVASLFVAVGEPERIVQARLVQLLVLVGGLFLFGPRLGITGVALAVDGMLFVGIGLLLWKAREHVDLSLRILFLAPCVALMSGLLLARSTLLIPGVLGSDWRTAGVKLVTYSTVYVTVLFLLERRQMHSMLEMMSHQLQVRKLRRN